MTSVNPDFSGVRVSEQRGPVFFETAFEDLMVGSGRPVAQTLVVDWGRLVQKVDECVMKLCAHCIVRDVRACRSPFRQLPWLIFQIAETRSGQPTCFGRQVEVD